VPGEGNLNVALEGWGIWGKTAVSFFGVQGLTDLQDRIFPLLVNHSFKGSLKEV